MKHGADELLHHAQQLLDRFPPDLDNAKKFYDKALEHHCDNVKVLEAAAQFSILSGETAEACRLLQKALEIAPSTGPSKYFYLAQLDVGGQSVNLIQKGIALLETELMNSNCTHMEKRVISRQLSSACCSIAELYMTDLCDEEDAQSICEKYVKAALEHDSTSFEALHISATFNNVIGDAEAAKQAALNALAVLRSLSKKMEKGSFQMSGSRSNSMEVDNDNDFIPDTLEMVEKENGEKENGEQENGEKENGEKENYDNLQPHHSPLIVDNELPSVELRTTFVEVLLSVQLEEEAVEVLHALLDEDEENIRVWYLLGIALMQLEMHEDAMHAASRGQQLIKDENEFKLKFVELSDEIIKRRTECEKTN